MVSDYYLEKSSSSPPIETTQDRDKAVAAVVTDESSRVAVMIVTIAFTFT